MNSTGQLGNNPLISVIVPVFNSARYIKNGLLSILSQTYKNYEIVIVDDGSDDHTREGIEEVKNSFKDRKIIILAQSHKGAGAARNLGLEHAQAELVAFLDSDDLWLPEKLQRTVNIFNSRQEINLVSHDLIRIYQNGYKEKFLLHRRYNPRADYFVNLYKSNCLVTSTVTVKKSILFKVGMFDEDFPPAEEYDLWLKMAHLVKPYYIKEPLGYYLIREGSQSENVDRRLRQEIGVLKKHFPEFKAKYPFAGLVLRKRTAQILGAVGKEWLLRRKIKKAVPLFVRALAQWPFNFKIFLYPLWVFYISVKKGKGR